MMTYTRDIPTAAGDAAIEQTRQHVREHLASIADPDDYPALADHVELDEHTTEGEGMLRIVGTLDAEPNAPYLKDGYDPGEAEGNGL